LNRLTFQFEDACVLRLPPINKNPERARHFGLADTVAEVAANLGESATMIIIGEVSDLVNIHSVVGNILQYQLWVVLRRSTPLVDEGLKSLTHDHVGMLIYTKYRGQLRHTKTRLAYSFCPTCEKTTKDYGGKKHTYDSFGTLISDVWRDIQVDLNSDIAPAVDRLADLFGIPEYSELRIIELKGIDLRLVQAVEPRASASSIILTSRLLNGDCLEQLATLPDNSIDFAFADPPYNLKKEYRNYSDDMIITDYFQWCDQWISEVARLLKPGATFALLNIPLWSVRHFVHLQTVLQFQNWIVWDALSFPVRRIMPAHYTILTFSKGPARPLPGLTGEAGDVELSYSPSSFRTLQPMDSQFCLRPKCITVRKRLRIDDRAPLTDIWSDIHRLKHNSKRVDHPCQLPPQLMYRLIGLFTKPDEMVLDCFNGAGTTTLAAHQLGRRYLGIEREPKYHEMACARHEEIAQGFDPFRKETRELTSKNSPVARIVKRKYEVPKKTLQLEARRVAMLLGHLPTRDEMIMYGAYAIEYYDDYFVSWGEVCAAARADGMSETREQQSDREKGKLSSQPRLF
jgi:site-specific DNA-methyltransferase (adenine-specific)